MVREDRVVMSGSELRRAHVIRQVIAQQLTQRKAGEALGVTVRHIRRLRDRLQAEGTGGLAHRSRGKPSNRRTPAPFQTPGSTALCAPLWRFWADLGGGATREPPWAPAQR